MRLPSATVETGIGALRSHRRRIGHRVALTAGVCAVVVNLARTDLRADEHAAGAESMPSRAEFRCRF
ncbi:hypothetical protein CH298_13530 [Rhodococcoides fascians]|nr:hypothetical protein CH303_13410 [Rhodococcus fascians]OZF18305.1 hypothetical protein CH298_13530 [Rhodococcus fascians]OZF21756.1 hypothetical protein CH297_13425 [Rhodococcus fascians]OZF67381.1 hypothetical protein CH308_13325 [Rhodococcus fascians]OZF70571.1 hypothetical protein CH307_13520 [Rhodococcus fascians]